MPRGVREERCVKLREERFELWMSPAGWRAVGSGVSERERERC